MPDDLVADRIRDIELREAVQEAISGVIEGSASPWALIRRADVQKLRQLLRQEADS